MFLNKRTFKVVVNIIVERYIIIYFVNNFFLYFEIFNFQFFSLIIYFRIQTKKMYKKLTLTAVFTSDICNLSEILMKMQIHSKTSFF